MPKESELREFMTWRTETEMTFNDYQTMYEQLHSPGSVTNGTRHGKRKRRAPVATTSKQASTSKHKKTSNTAATANDTLDTGTDDDELSTCEDNELSAYEVTRNETILKNAAYLASLGL